MKFIVVFIAEPKTSSIPILVSICSVEDSTRDGVSAKIARFVENGHILSGMVNDYVGLTAHVFSEDEINGIQ